MTAINKKTETKPVRRYRRLMRVNLLIMGALLTFFITTAMVPMVSGALVSYDLLKETLQNSGRINYQLDSSDVVIGR